MFLFDFSYNKKYFSIVNRAIQEMLASQEERYVIDYYIICYREMLFGVLKHSISVFLRVKLGIQVVMGSQEARYVLLNETPFTVKQ